MVMSASAVLKRLVVIMVPCSPSMRQSREVKWTDVNGAELLAKHKDKPVKITIEHLRDGSSYRCDALPARGLMFAGERGGKVQP